MIRGDVEHIAVTIAVQGDVDELCEDGGDAEDRQGTPEAAARSVRKSAGMNVDRRQQHHDMPEEAMGGQQRMSRMHEALMYNQRHGSTEEAVILQEGQ